MTRRRKIRVLVVDEHPIMRLGAAALIGGQSDMEVVAQAATGRDAIELHRSAHPDVTLMDLPLPGMSGAEAIRIIRQESPDARFVVLAQRAEDDDVRQAVAAGAQGCVAKGKAQDALLDALRQVHAGNRVLPAPQRAGTPPEWSLSPREREVLALMAHGRSNKEIAASLGIAESTVKCHVGVILARLRVTDRTQAVVAALQRGLVRLEPRSTP